ncbi:MAG TPA: cyclic nucleotide-binding domain-containing protein [bacterium]|nr:cyclic nucleotide-binding domain-containing protein [bacterium]
MDLKKVVLFRDFKQEELNRFGSIIETLEIKAGGKLFNDGDPGDALYIIYEGSVRIFKTIDADSGEEKSLALLPAGAYLGEMTLLEGSPRSASARAETDSVILRISRDSFIRLLREYPQAAIRLFVSFMNVLSERLRRTNEELVVLFEVGKIVSTMPPLNEMLEKIVQLLVNTVKADIGVVFILNEITQKLEARVAIGEGSVSLINLKTKASEGIAAGVVRANDTLCVCHLDQCVEFEKTPRFGYERPHMLVAPLVRKDRPFGAILLGRDDPARPFDNANVNLINGVASQASAAIESALFHQDNAAKQEFDRKYFQF